MLCYRHQPVPRKVPEEDHHEGWFLQVGNANQGVIEELWFPLHEAGGPIAPGAAASLLDCTDPFKMSPGQWRFLFLEYQLSWVETFSSGESLLVETGVALSTGSRLEESVNGAWEF